MSEQFSLAVYQKFAKNSGNFGQNVNVRQFWLDRSGNLRNIRNVMKGIPKCPTEISE